jgi:hypothetical protein
MKVSISASRSSAAAVGVGVRGAASAVGRLTSRSSLVPISLARWDAVLAFHAWTNHRHRRTRSRPVWVSRDRATAQLDQPSHLRETGVSRKGSDHQQVLDGFSCLGQAARHLQGDQPPWQLPSSR